MLSRFFGKAGSTNQSATDSSQSSAKSWSQGLRSTSAKLGVGLKQLLSRRTQLDQDAREELEDLLLSADVGIETTQVLIDRLDQAVAQSPQKEDLDYLARFRQILIDTLERPQKTVSQPAEGTQVVMLVGVNGVGKTTSIGKLAHSWKNKGHSILLAAGDTYRAAATEQLAIWAERTGVPMVAQKQGADSASVLYDALQSAQSRKVDILIADTAGRLQNKTHLMEELAKVIRVLRKLDPSAPHEVLLAVDATTGQNALSQAREFASIAPLTGLIITKLDGTAKGGIIFALAEQMQIPVRYIGIGEGIDDLRPFDASSIVDALLTSENTS